MPTDHRTRLATVKRFDQLIAYLRDEMGWPIARDSFEDVDDLFYDFTADELGIDPKTAAKIQEIKRLRPLSPKQPWGIFFVKFEPKKLPVVALRRILSQVALKKRPSANNAERAAWAADDLLFVSNYGEGDERQISFAHFSRAQDGRDLPTLKVLGWDNRDTALHLDAVARELNEHLAWPEEDNNAEAWRTRWRAAFTLGHREVVTTSRELSIRLAELARNIRDRIKAAIAIETDKGPLTRLMKAFQEALVHDLDADGFADMYAQTIAYGLLSARIADPHKKTSDDFAAHMRTNPFLRELMETFLKVGGRRGKAGGPGIDFDELGVSEVVELLDDANMEAVVRDFGDRNPQEDPVIHFYELFLKEYDARKRMQRGVFYTPRPVVSYIVRSVDELLRTEFGLADGLADAATWGEMAKRHKNLKIPEGVSPDQDFVQLLDPATGTGTFLVEVIDLTHQTLVAKWRGQGHGVEKIDAMWNDYVPKHLLTRLHGYELLMAPYAIAHLKIGLKLYETGYRFGSAERARIYLTNALEPATDAGQQALAGLFPALAHEADAVNRIKRTRCFTVMIGNPPYAKLSSNRESSAEALVAPFKEAVRGERNIQPLSDDYLKFLGLALAASVRVPLFGFGMITNRGYLNGLIHRGVRKVISSSWPMLRLVDLHGDSNVGERIPAGFANENVFDIQQGVAITIGAKGTPVHRSVRRIDVWGTRDEKQAQLMALNADDSLWTTCSLQPPQFFFEATTGAITEPERLIPLCDVMPVTNTGLKTHRDELVIDFDPDALATRIRRFQDPRRTEAEVRLEFFGEGSGGRYKLGDNRDWSMVEARERLRHSKKTIKESIEELDYRPFDRRFIFYNTAVIDFAREDLMRHMQGGRNIGLVATRQVPNSEFCHVFVTRRLIEMKSGSHDRGTNLLPLWLKHERTSFLDSAPQLNFTTTFVKDLGSALGRDCAGPYGLPQGVSAESVFGYIYSVLHSPSYRTRHGRLLKIDFPRIPLPCGLGLFQTLSDLGNELVALHLVESPRLDHFITKYVGPKEPEVGRVGWSDNTVWLDAERTKKGEEATAGTRGFHGVPEVVWSFRIGGYQVCEKWLKDRKGRTLSKDDLAHYQKIVVALAETIRLMKEIDEVIEQHGGWPGAFQTLVYPERETNPLLKVAESKTEYGTEG